VPFDAKVVRVLIASPSDTSAYRLVVRDVVEEWNSLHSETERVVLLPVIWERDATPEMGERPQGIINRQLVETADVLIGVFWNRLGTATSEAESGTAEEIGRFNDAGKPVLLYFSHEPVAPDTLETDQLERLREFRNEISERALLVDFDSRDDLRQKAMAGLTRTIRHHVGAPSEDTAAPVEVPEAPETLATGRPRAALVAHVQRDREFSGVSSSGTPRYGTRERLLIENRGTGDAEDLTFRFVAPDDGRPPDVFREDRPIARLPAGGSLEFPMATTMGSAGQWEIVFNWQEDGTGFSSQQTLT
jgi:nucleoside 2-deoxyribosyltransferase